MLFVLQINKCSRDKRYIFLQSFQAIADAVDVRPLEHSHRLYAAAQEIQVSPGFVRLTPTTLSSTSCRGKQQWLVGKSMGLLLFRTANLETAPRMR